MSKPLNRTSFVLLLLAAIGAGALSGSIIGFLVVRRPRSLERDAMAETVDDLKRRAEKILDELSHSAASSSHVQ